MKKSVVTKLLLISIFALLFSTVQAQATTNAQDLQQDSRIGLQRLYRSSPAAKKISSVAKGILIFPKVTKAGFMIGGQYGEGTLLVRNRVNGYYNTVAASFGLQIGAQSYGYALFFMTDSALKYLEKSSGWEVGVGPTVTIVDEGIANSLSTTTAKDDIYAFFFGQQGLMAGVGIQGSKISPIKTK